MKARVLIMAMMVAFTSFANAQEKQVPQPNKEIEVCVKRMTDRLLLDDSKAAKFVPLYQAYLEEKAACRFEPVCGETLTDAQIEANMEGMLKFRENDLAVNAVRGKNLTNVRASGSDHTVVLKRPRPITLEYALDYINSDELVEVTPSFIRLRKRILNTETRKKFDAKK